jgi:hypothetical protein
MAAEAGSAKTKRERRPGGAFQTDAPRGGYLGPLPRARCRAASSAKSRRPRRRQDPNRPKTAPCAHETRDPRSEIQDSRYAGGVWSSSSSPPAAGAAAVGAQRSARFAAKRETPRRVPVPSASAAAAEVVLWCSKLKALTRHKAQCRDMALCIASDQVAARRWQIRWPL